MMLPCRATRWCMTTKLAVFLYFDAKYKPSNFPLFAVQIFKGYACLSYCLGYDPFYFIFKTLNQGKLYWHFVCRAFIPIKTALFIHSFKMLAVSQYWYFECNKIRFVYAALPGAALPGAALPGAALPAAALPAAATALPAAATALPAAATALPAAATALPAAATALTADAATIDKAVVVYERFTQYIFKTGIEKFKARDTLFTTRKSYIRLRFVDKINIMC